MRHSPGAGLAALLSAQVLAPAALRATESTPDSAHLKQRLTALKARLQEVDQQLEALTRRRKGILVDLQSISLQADRMRAQAESARLRRDQTKAEVQGILVRKEETRRQIALLREGLRKQVRWMQALGPWGGVAFLGSTRSFDDFLRRERYLTWWRNQERQRLDRVRRLQGELTQREEEGRRLLERLATEEKEAMELQTALRLNEDRLTTYLQALMQDELRKKQLQAELAEEAIQLERMLGNLLSRPRTEPFEPARAFIRQRGELPLPVPGQLAQGFGEHIHPRFKTRTTQSGVLVIAEPGAPVQAVADGRVVFAETYQSYGPMVILDHGDGFFTLYQHLQGLLVTKGQVVRQSEVLGLVGETLDGPRLGFEIRQQTRPQDPQRWFRNRYR